MPPRLAPTLAASTQVSPPSPENGLEIPPTAVPAAMAPMPSATHTVPRLGPELALGRATLTQHHEAPSSDDEPQGMVVVGTGADSMESADDNEHGKAKFIPR